MLGRTRRIHFVGVGGSGMNGIAELLANLGYDVTGSDAKRSDVTDRLEQLGVRAVDRTRGRARRSRGRRGDVVGHSGGQPGGRRKPGAAAIPVIPRAEMLAELMRLRYGIAIAGAHGKTTTTSMVALVLEQAGLDPTAVIGGRLSAFGSNARLGRGEYMVVEADESDRSFLKLSPSIAVITNIDREHMESYGSWENLQQAFADFANKVPFYGAVIACADDGPVRELLPTLTRRVITYALSDRQADVVAPRHAARSLRVLLRRAAPRRGRRDDGAWHDAAQGSGAAQPPERARDGRGRAGSGRPVCAHGGGARGVPRRGAAIPDARRGTGRDGGRRLRPSPDRDCRRHRRRAGRDRSPRASSCSSRTATRAPAS